MSNEDSETKWLYGVGGAVIGGALVYLFDHHEDADEDRPPILVRDSSLIFQSGDPAGEPEEMYGKPWNADSDDWQPHHPNGKATKWFLVEITPSSGDCPPLSMTKKIEITYRGEQFKIEAKNQFGKGNKKVPTISGPGLQRDGSPDNPQLVYDKGSGEKISKVEFKTRGGVTVSCPSPVLIRIWQV